MIPLLIGLVGLMVGFLQVQMGKRQLQAFRWNQALKTMELAEQWLGQHMTSVRSFARRYYEYELLMPIDIVKLKADPDWIKISTSFMSILNYFDIVALACMRGIVDEEMCYTIFCYVFTNHLKIFRPFIDHVRLATHHEQAPIKAWGCFETLATKWERLLLEQRSVSHEQQQAIWYNRISDNVMDSADNKSVSVRVWPFRRRRQKSF